MIRRTYYLRVDVTDQFDNLLASCWSVRGTYSLFAQPVKLVSDVLEELQAKYPGTQLDLKEFRKV